VGGFFLNIKREKQKTLSFFIPRVLALDKPPNYVDNTNIYEEYIFSRFYGGRQNRGWQASCGAAK